MPPRDAMHTALATLQRAPDVEYADLRFVNDQHEGITVRDGVPAAIDRREARTLGVRVLSNGAWGFAGTTDLSETGIQRAARAALDLARASGTVGGDRVTLAPIEAPARGTYATAYAIDPFTVSMETKIGLLSAATRVLQGRGAPIRRTEARMGWTRQHKVLLTTEGTDVEQRLLFGGAGMHCVALGDDGQAQRRSYPTYADGEAGQGGYERVEGLDLLGNAERVRDEAVALLTADPVPVGRRTVLLESSQLALQVHESCGHPTELDRALGTEVSLAGGSFLQPSMLGSFQYGSPRVNLTADARTPGGLGTFGWDDEGTPAGRTPLVQEGRFVGYLSSRETAARFGGKSSGAMRADGGLRLPLIRMVNVNLEADPHGPSLEALIADTEDGVLIATNKSWSIDDVRLNFQFGCEIAWEIKHGRRVRILRNPVYTGVTPNFWRSCDAICGPDEWRLWGVLNCGKGEPMQTMQVGHGTAPARFRDVEVGHG